MNIMCVQTTTYSLINCVQLLLSSCFPVYLDERLTGSEDEAAGGTESDAPDVAEVFVECQQLSTGLQVPYLDSTI